jgi:predicted enzyme related to lactoylglutathione lyase
MLTQPRIGAIVFFVADLSRSLRFYRETLGVDANAVDGEDGPFGVAQLGELTLVFIARASTPGDSPVVVFGVDGGIDDLAESLAQRGVEIVVPVSHCPDGGLSVDFLDPDRNVLSIYQPAGAPRRNA